MMLMYPGLNIMEASRQNGVERFIYASSSSNYGDSVKLPKIEDQIETPSSICRNQIY